MAIKKVKKLLDEQNNLCNYELTYDDDKVWCVPIREENTMYQEIQEWVAKGNTIEAAD
jgi:hypothetical protein|tara:strand:+ start:395 stop:568 length:174 start_codon:yes stop_codon:yes gene_type:complete